MKENTILRIKLGKEDEKIKEGFSTWILRKSATVVLPIYSFKTYIQEKQFLPSLKRLINNRSKILKYAFRLAIVNSIVSSVIEFSSARTNSK